MTRQDSNLHLDLSLSPALRRFLSHECRFLRMEPSRYFKMLLEQRRIDFSRLCKFPPYNSRETFR